MKYTKMLLLALICFVSQASVKADDSKDDGVPVSKNSAVRNVGKGFLKAGLSAAQLASAGIGAFAAAVNVVIPFDESQPLEGKVRAAKMAVLCSVMTATLLKSSWDNGKSALQTLRKSFDSSKKSELTEPVPKQISASPDGPIIKKVAKTALGFLQLGAAVMAFQNSFEFIKGWKEALSLRRQPHYFRDYALPLGFWGTVGLTNLFAGWKNVKPAMESLPKPVDNLINAALMIYKLT